ncbi:hypothetical protein DVH24_034211 [Malus domestica]|uniref:Uncharacterized protein n=1 Tax=Malus domestica TaxID=3750 RepID=A0A498I9W3_MALDO|nr:hypothetical protein DVH24_034211 [Malus domestica]
MTKYYDRLREVERYKAKFKENKQFVNDARKMSKALVDAIRLKDENFESLKSALVEVSGLKRSIPTERDAAVQEFLGKAFILTVDPSSDDDSDNKASISEQSQESKDGPGDAEESGDSDGVETQNDIVRGSASDEDDS